MGRIDRLIAQRDWRPARRRAVGDASFDDAARSGIYFVVTPLVTAE
jgi:hypothetical protein